MKTYYQINGEDMLGILSKEPKRYDSLDKAIKVLMQLLNYSGVDDKYISCFDGLIDASAEKEVVIYKDDEDGDSLVYDYRYWITKETVQPVYIVLDDDRNIERVFPTKTRANMYLSDIANNCGNSWTFDDRKGQPSLQIIGTNGVILASYWIERHEVEIYE